MKRITYIILLTLLFITGCTPEQENNTTLNMTTNVFTVMVEAAKAKEKKTGFGELVKSPVSRGVNSAYGIGFLEGAEWADEHPDLYSVTRKAIAREREYMINKACDWMAAHITDEKYHPERGFWNIGRLRDDFKKYMEEQQ